MRMIALAFLSAAGLVGAANAQDAAQVETLFKAWDKDANGALSKAEWREAGRREEGFGQIDVDADGKVTLDELKAAMARLKRGR